MTPSCETRQNCYYFTLCYSMHHALMVFWQTQFVDPCLRKGLFWVGNCTSCQSALCLLMGHRLIFIGHGRTQNTGHVLMVGIKYLQ
jgi:hypothetical protein